MQFAFDRLKDFQGCFCYIAWWPDTKWVRLKVHIRAGSSLLSCLGKHVKEETMKSVLVLRRKVATATENFERSCVECCLFLYRHHEPSVCQKCIRFKNRNRWEFWILNFEIEAINGNYAGESTGSLKYSPLSSQSCVLTELWIHQCSRFSHYVHQSREYTTQIPASSKRYVWPEVEAFLPRKWENIIIMPF